MQHEKNLCTKIRFSKEGKNFQEQRKNAKNKAKKQRMTNENTLRDPSLLCGAPHRSIMQKKET